MIESFKPMKPEKVESLPNTEGYIYQLKVDGGNAVIDVELPSIKIYHARDDTWTNRTYRYPDLVEQIKNGYLKDKATYIGELTVLDETGIGRQKLFMHRQIENPFDVNRTAKQYPVHFYAHHIIRNDNELLWNVPYSQIIKMLPDFVKETNQIHIIPMSNKPDVFMQQKGIEGIVAKKIDGIYYRGKRGNGWIKKKFLKEETVKFISYENRDVGINLWTDKQREVHLAGERVKLAIQSIESEGCVIAEIEFLDKTWKGYRDCSIKRLWKPSEKNNGEI